MILEEKTSKIISIISIILCIFGKVGNIVSITICMRKSLRKTPTFIYMVFTSLVDIIPLAVIVLYSLNFLFLDLQLRFANFEFCKILIFLTLWSCQSSAYLLVSFFILQNLTSVFFIMNFLAWDAV